jgi:hypothetical protein
MKPYHSRSHTARQRTTGKPPITIAQRQARTRRKRLVKLFKYLFTIISVEVGHSNASFLNLLNPKP